MRLSHVTLRTRDLVRSRAFYLSLGFELVVDEAHYCRFLTHSADVPGDETLSIEAAKDPVAASTAELGLEFGSASALDAYVASLAGRGVALASGPDDRPWLWREARLADPDGHVWVLFYAGANKLDPPWRVARRR